jgi:cell division transport system permease protein
MSLSSLWFLIEEAGRNIRRNGLMSVAALTTVTIAMAVFGGSVYGIYRLHQFVQAQPSQFGIAVFLRADATRADAIALQRRLAGLPGVSSVDLYTKEQALGAMMAEDARRGSGVAAALEENPFPDRLDVRLEDPRQTRAIADALRNRSVYPTIDAVRDDRETLDKLLATSRLIRNVGGVLAALLFIATAFVIQNTIRLTVYARRREIRIMQLVGATPGFIRLPLVLEAIFYGAFGGLAAAGLVLFVVSQVSTYVGRFETPLGQGAPPAVGARVVLSGLVLVGGAIGAVSGIVAVRRFLRRV